MLEEISENVATFKEEIYARSGATEHQDDHLANESGMSEKLRLLVAEIGSGGSVFLKGLNV